jgi:hypothetical protein
MLDPNVSYTELEAAARKRWPKLFPGPGRVADKLLAEAPKSLLQTEAAAFRKKRGVGKTGLVMPAAAMTDDARHDVLGTIAIEREVVIRAAAPVFRIRNGQIDLANARAGQETWFGRIKEAEAKLGPRYGAIGRIEATLSPNGPEALGTAWLIDRDVIVTNAHVARYFAETSERGWRFRSQHGFDRRSMLASLDVGEDANSPGGSLQKIEEILFVSPTRDPDIAFLRISGSGLAAAPIPCFKGVLPEGLDVAVIGYPERDDSLDRREVERYFGDVWGWKRFAPGMLGQIDPNAVRHLCNTLGGNSGSPLLDLETGHLVGLHYGGIPDRRNPVNYALPASVVFKLLGDLRSPSRRTREESMPPRKSSPTGHGAPVAASLTIPLTLTINLSVDGSGANSVTASVLEKDAAGVASGAHDLDSAVAEAKAVFGRRDDVVHVRAGWKVIDGIMTDTRAIVVAVSEKKPEDTLIAGGRLPLPASFAGFPVDVSIASADDLLDEFGDPLVTEASRRIAYRERPELMPERIRSRMKLMVHPGPDAGSGMLLDFLNRTEKALTVGMYEFSATHVLDGMILAMKGRRKLSMVLQKGGSIGEGAKVNDISDEETVERLEKAMSRRFKNQWSSTAIHPHYHIKVAAQDDKALWLSSGSWQSSNQPSAAEKGPHSRHNREFHVTAGHKDLAVLFRKHVEADAVDARAALERETVAFAEPLFWVPDEEVDLVTEAATPPSFFPPLEIDREVQMLPLLTPDNFCKNLLPLIERATKSILFHNQSFGIAQTRSDDFEGLLKALLDKQRNAETDVRIIFRGNERRVNARPNLDKMKTYGFRVGPDHVRIQPRLHNKMWIFDDKHVVIGSHNFTNQGVTINRDASLIFYNDAEIAEYCRKVFEHDWERLAQKRIAEPPRGARRAIPGESPPPGMRAVTASALGL